jgi:hypothetical protein
LLLEGKSITALLAQVRAEHGDDVTIVAAEKIRSGGVGGFFAKERYALTVEVEPGSDAPVPAVMHDLADTGTRTNRTPDVHSVMHDRADQVLAPGSLLDLAAAIDEAEAAENSVILATRPMHSPAEQPMLSTTSPEFASILARLTALDGQQPVIPDSAPAAEPVERPDAYTRLREALSEIAPHIDFNADVPVVLVIPPAAAAPAPVQPVHAAQPVAAEIPAAPEPPAPVIPHQGRHRRAVDA